MGFNGNDGGFMVISWDFIADFMGFADDFMGFDGGFMVI